MPNSIVKCLVEGRTDIIADDAYALRWAIERNHKEVIEYLKNVE